MKELRTSKNTLALLLLLYYSSKIITISELFLNSQNEPSVCFLCFPTTTPEKNNPEKQNTRRNLSSSNFQLLTFPPDPKSDLSLCGGEWRPPRELKATAFEHLALRLVQSLSERCLICSKLLIKLIFVIYRHFLLFSCYL
jgi:hypothetical protein